MPSMSRRIRLGEHQQKVLQLMEADFTLKTNTMGYCLVSPVSTGWIRAQKGVIESLERAGLIAYGDISGWRLTGKPWHSGYYRQ